MVSILPSARSPFDVIGADVGQALQGILPQAVEKGYTRGRGLNALEKAQQEMTEAQGDPFKTAMAFARVGAENPALERVLGPLYQTAIQQGRVNKAFGPQPTQQQALQGAPSQAAEQAANQIIPQQQIQDLATSPNLQAKNSTLATPSPFNVMTADQMDADAQNYAKIMNDPNAYQTRYAQLENKNNSAILQRNALEDFALKSDVSPSDLPRFMLVGAKYDPRNPSEWAQNTKREWMKVKANDEKLQKAFIPGIGSGLIGKNRAEALKSIENSVQDLVKAGLEQETRNKLADEYLTPTEIEGLIHPLTPQKSKTIQSLPKSVFPLNKENRPTTKRGFLEQEPSEFVSYEEAKVTAPKELQFMQDQLADFFMKNIDKETSLLQLRDKIVHDKDYDWRQIGPAIRQAMEMGLKLEPFQSTEMTDVETQPPYDSLGDIFRDWDRIPKYLRGNK